MPIKMLSVALRSKSLKAAIVVAGTASVLTAGSVAIASPASAHTCGIHYDHWDGGFHFKYVSGHTHSWGDHHHIWEVSNAANEWIGNVHVNCN